MFIAGTIYVSGLLDRETEPSYTLNVTVTDLGVIPGPLGASTLVHITILDANDNPPRFQNAPSVLEIKENRNPGTFIGGLFATDRDEGSNGLVTYKLINFEGE